MENIGWIETGMRKYGEELERTKTYLEILKRGHAHRRDCTMVNLMEHKLESKRGVGRPRVVGWCDERK